MQALPPSCPPLPDLPPLFWAEVTKQVAYWQEFFAQAAPGDAPPDEMRKVCIARIKTRLKRLYAGRERRSQHLRAGPIRRLPHGNRIAQLATSALVPYSQLKPQLNGSAR